MFFLHNYNMKACYKINVNLHCKFLFSGHSNLVSSQQVQGAGSRDRSTGNPANSNVNRASQSKGAGSSHQSSHSDGSRHSDQSVHSKRYQHRKQSRHSDRSRDSDGSRHRKHSRDSDGSRHTDRSVHSKPYRHRKQSRDRDQSRDSDGFRNSKRYQQRKQSRHSDRSRDSDGSRHRKHSRDSDGSRHTDRSEDSNQMGHNKQSRDDYESVQTPISRYSGRSFSEQSNRSSAYESSHAEHRRETDIRFPMAMAKFQKKVLTKLVDIHMEVRRMGRSEPPLSSAHIEQLETMEEFEREEERLKDKQAFESLVLQLARIGGKDVRDCVHKILDRLFTNRLMAKFNMKGKGKKQKLPLETTTTFEAIKAAVMKWDKEATEATIKHHAAEHLKHAPGRKGGGGHIGVE
ncbi:serine/threonine-protein kinase fray2-like isoform X3 [Triplophysa dalaica]|uniref:serine/threonine-protein kinase fray2-like isoform X3 n=1 Tax=Triplophysa dalaica TaxID=1582913 RepID=UPI0024DF6E3F|nr:serine/threonine-protein kinase fray2-like isoform X3 [Triplophysa dalaica]